MKEELNQKEIEKSYRHSCAHVLADAVCQLFPDVKIITSNETDTVFYYDFDLNGKTFSLEDLTKISEKMEEVISDNVTFVRMDFYKIGENFIAQDNLGKVDKIILNEFIKNKNNLFQNEYKKELFKKIYENSQHRDNISFYQHDKFIDLCKGPHVESTNLLKNFKLLNVSASERNGIKTQRIQGICFETKEKLDNYLKFLEEADKRDHRKLGQKLDLFHQQEEAPGDVFWHKNGAVLYNIVENYMRQKILANGYFEVKTPLLLSKKLWEKSGHWEKYRANMFTSRVEEEEMDFAIKPMNCPGHVEIFSKYLVSYRDLPMRMMEFGRCHRYEPSGSLHGLMRVRAFLMDDAHIFCTEEQIQDEALKVYKLLKEIYHEFGFKDIAIKFSDRPESRAGSDETWDRAENALMNAMKAMGEVYTINKGEGAFYGPKLEFVLKDAIGREWQCGTLQVDLVLPERFDANYINKDGEKQRPVMMHRAILGSFERFIAILIEHYAGAFPLWLSPVQVVVLGINNELDQNVLDIVNELKSYNIRAESDLSSDTISYKIRQHSELKIPYIVTLGNREIENNTISVRKFGENLQKTMKISEFLEIFSKNK